MKSVKILPTKIPEGWNTFDVPLTKLVHSDRFVEVEVKSLCAFIGRIDYMGIFVYIFCFNACRFSSHLIPTVAGDIDKFRS